ncbi:hypothetical protein ABIB14_002672 [Arthrobacter sp. UYEF3]
MDHERTALLAQAELELQERIATCAPDQDIKNSAGHVAK